MENLRIKTVDAPHRTVDFIDCGEPERLPDANYDARTYTAFGVESLNARRHRRRYRLKFDALTSTDIDTLENIIADRQQVWFEGNVGDDTLVLAPFERARTNLIGGASGFARACVATYLDDDGYIKEVASGYPRYEAAKIGKGILLEPERTNYFYPSHGSSGDTIWSVNSGSPTINWDTGMPSNVDGETGTVRVEGDIGESIDVDITFPTSTPLASYIWVKGGGFITLSHSAGGSFNSGSTQLSMEWQKVIIESDYSTAGTVTLQIAFDENNTTAWISAHQMENGRNITSYIPTTGAAATRVIDQCFMTTNINYVSGSIAFWIRWPRLATSLTTMKLFYVDTQFYGQINSTGQIYFQFATGLAAYDTPSPMFSAGDMVHLAFVWTHGHAYIVVNGVLLDDVVITSRIAGTAATLQLYAGVQAPNTVIDDLRFDSKYYEWKIASSGDYVKYTNDWHLKLIKETQGRYFRPGNFQYILRDACEGYYEGLLELREVDSDEDHTVRNA